MTRAEKKLIITYAKRYGDNKRDSKESEFLNEINYKNNPDIDFISPKQDPITIKGKNYKGNTAKLHSRDSVRPT